MSLNDDDAEKIAEAVKRGKIKYDMTMGFWTVVIVLAIFAGFAVIGLLGHLSR